MTMRMAAGAALLAWAVAGARAAEAEGLAVPRAPDTAITAQPWDGGGLFLAALSREKDPFDHPVALAARAWMGWNDAGFRFLVEVADGTPVEEDQLWLGDSVEVFISPDPEGHPWEQVVVSPGRDPRYPEPRVRTYNEIDGVDNPSPLHAVRVTEGGYAVEILVPWSDLGVTPEEGSLLAVQVAVNDRTVQDGYEDRRRWLHQQSGRPHDRFLPLVRLSATEEKTAQSWSGNWDAGTDGGVRLALQADGSWAGQAVAVCLDGAALGETVFGPARDGWSDLLLDHPGVEGLAKRPIRLTVIFPDGQEATLPCRVSLPVHRPLGSGWQGENYHMNACFRYLMERLGHPEGEYGYPFFSAVTGDSFVQVHPGYCFSGTWRLKEDFRHVQDVVGRDFVFVHATEIREDPRQYCLEVADAIERGDPVLCFRDNEVPAVLVGYEEGGRRLLLHAHDQPAPQALDGGLETVEWLMFLGDPVETVSREEALRRAFLRVADIIALPQSAEGTYFGKEAYYSWADSLLDPAVRETIAKGGHEGWMAHGNQVCLTLTSEFQRGFFLTEARNSCPDLAGGLDAMQAVQDRLSVLHGRLNALGAGFFGPPRPWMDDQDSIDEVVALIREMGDVTAEFADCAAWAADNPARPGAAAPEPRPDGPDGIF